MRKKIGVILCICLMMEMLSGCGEDKTLIEDSNSAILEDSSEPEMADAAEPDNEQKSTEPDNGQEPTEMQRTVPEEQESSVKLTHGSGWRQYESMLDYGENGVKAKDIDFMSSNGRGYNNGVYWPMRDILYDLGQETGLNLLSDYWIVERVTPIGGEYYNVLLSQKALGRRVSLLWAMDSDEYKVLYVVCNEGDKETYNGVRYLSPADWMQYQEDYIPFSTGVLSDVSIEIENPFWDILETSTSHFLEMALMSYVETEGYKKNWEVREIFGWYSLTEYLVVSDDKILWICVDSYDNEKFAVEAFGY